jgi:hypothetical protein
MKGFSTILHEIASLSSVIEVATTDVGTQCNRRKADNMKIKEETILL